MEELRSYTLRIVTAAMIAGLILAMSRSSSQWPVIRLACGVFLSAVVLQPLSGGIPEISLNWTEDATREGNMLADAGTLATQRAMADIITGELEAYILDKAADRNVSVEADVTLDVDLLPAGVIIRGTVPASVKAELEQLLEEELGIPKENQTWTG